ncbi:MAG: glycosyltransferase family 9 protein, partial [Candidatus Goldbacteria bacterium]|nr:glycosyltransferase family 9 protein [Candidatus Goldiibacteriota bacterium]
RKFFYNIPVVPDIVPKYNVYYYLDLLKPLRIKDDGIQTEIYYSNQDEVYIKNFILELDNKNYKIIGINPMGSWITKRWPVDKFIKLIELILNEMPNTKIVLIWGPGEYEMVSNIKKCFMENKCVLLAPKTNINQLAALIKNLDILVTNDGAPKHIAVATKTRTLTIYGPTNYKSWGPSDTKEHLSIFSGIDCAPCDKMQCKDRDIECMKNIRVEDVFEKIKTLIL